MTRPVGVFDSGVGGLSVFKALRAHMPAEAFVYLADSRFAPYGERGDAFVIERTRAVVRQLRDEYAIKALVIACNTATAAAIHLVRAEHPDLPLVGVEPALKPAVALSKTGRIGVMATRGTVQSSKLRALHDSLKGQAEFILQPCDGLADAIQNHDVARINALCGQYTQAIGPFGNQPGQVDALVLGCTHYAFAWDTLQALVGPDVRLIETGEPVARQTRRLLEAAGQLRQGSVPGSVTLLATGPQEALNAAAKRWLNL
ncbi:glutamate racemase [Polaromonas sp. YR568]|uniref:glutamate racemase n=1 Tax=Polaromonas sp. YR568 TaxID=1855301 RepID=UPI0008EE0A09|nr:glutamate racemase [Polaromonas sp. YR568]SFU55441.1 glutamate racemase [Polaromonas sp. YR568]